MEIMRRNRRGMTVKKNHYGNGWKKTSKERAGKKKKSVKAAGACGQRRTGGGKYAGSRPWIQPGRRRRRRKKAEMRSCIPLLTEPLFLAAAFYLLFSLNFIHTYLPNTIIRGISVSGLTAEEAKEKIAAQMGSYELVLEERGGRKEIIRGMDITLRPVYDGTLEKIMGKQNPLLWGARYVKGEEYESAGFGVRYDEAILEMVVRKLRCMDPEEAVPPADACLVYTDNEGLQIKKEEQGNYPVPGRLLQEARRAVDGLEARISLEELDIYKKPEILEDDPVLLAQREAYGPYAQVSIIYQFGDSEEKLDGNTICGWLQQDKSGRVTVDTEAVKEYVNGLARKYNTAYCTKELKTSYGPTVAITKGHYGWMIDKEGETDALVELITACQSQKREPLYLQTAASHAAPDYGDTYVEMNLTAQHLFFYRDGELLIETDFVSGNESKGWGTPAGAYELTYKQRNAVLKGKNYNTPVTCWMPFNGDIGMHDGYWRSGFGGNIYKKSGSHGCINLPPDAAEFIFENIEPQTPILCYYLEGTESE